MGKQFNLSYHPFGDSVLKGKQLNLSYHPFGDSVLKSKQLNLSYHSRADSWISAKEHWGVSFSVAGLQQPVPGVPHCAQTKPEFGHWTCIGSEDLCALLCSLWCVVSH